MIGAIIRRRRLAVETFFDRSSLAICLRLVNESVVMASSTPVSRVVVIGGGIFGVSTAVHLARRGVGATLVTDGPPANGASGRFAGVDQLLRACARPGHTIGSRMIGIDRYRTLSATSRCPDARWLRFDGGLTWDTDDDSNGIVAAFKHERSIGYEADWLAAQHVAAVTPGIDPRAITPQGAIFNPGEGWVDLPSLIEVLLREFAALGGEVVSNAGPASVNVAHRRSL